MVNTVDLLAQNLILFYALALLTGLLVGSFINVVILRMPPLLEYSWKAEYAEYTETTFSQEKPPGIAFDRSHCPKCKKKLSGWHNVPVVSYLFLRGKCYFCEKKISIRYPLIELLTALLSVILAVKFGVSMEFLTGMVLLWFLMVITWIDFDTFLIPDQLSLTLLWLGLALSLMSFSISPQQAIQGALLGYLSLWTVFHVFKIITGKDGMGYGDFKLLSAGGAWLGPEMLIAVLLIASISGLIFALVQTLLKNSQSKIPFGPYLSIGIMTCYLYGDPMMGWMFPDI